MAKYLMVQGTSSGCGKSLLVTALCRLSKKRMLKVSPLKAQNMSLQSYVTEEGGEIGIAQAIQAKASGITPSLHHNPILLKPAGEKGIQVIVHGKLYKTLSSEELASERNKLWSAVETSLNHLSAKYDLIIIEGAGSPAEINLLDQDIANIRLAKYLNAPVILVGDIDRGGVFASLYGTVKLLDECKPGFGNLIKGFIINKFRGKLEILSPGIERLERLLNKPCLGVIPFLFETGIADEDGVTKKLQEQEFSYAEKPVKIVILKLKHISNFSDFEPLRFEPDVDLVFSLREEDLASADIIILPGSKQTIDDLMYIKRLGIDRILKELAKRKYVEIVGICGGFQMLGEKLFDPECVESSYKEVDGLSLLPCYTVFYPEKITTQVKGHLLSNPFIKVEGYEIHKGITIGDMNLFRIRRKATNEWLTDGMIKGNIWGTYLHGLFENDDFRRWLINRHRTKKGFPPLEMTFSWKILEDQYIEKLAEVVEKHIDIDRIWEIAGV
jgi:adenosylcobyric acid synthase